MRPMFRLLSDDLREREEQIRQLSERLKQLEQENAQLLEKIGSPTIGDAQGLLKEC